MHVCMVQQLFREDDAWVRVHVIRCGGGLPSALSPAPPLNAFRKTVWGRKSETFNQAPRVTEILASPSSYVLGLPEASVASLSFVASLFTFAGFVTQTIHARLLATLALTLPVSTRDRTSGPSRRAVARAAGKLCAYN